MNILYLCPFVPDVRANHAGGVCMGKQLETLKKNNNVFVLTFCNNEYEQKLLKDHPDYQYVRTSTSTFIANALLHPGLPIFFGVRASKAYKKKVLQILSKEKIDAVHAEYTSMGQYVWIKKKYPHIQFHLIEHDVTIQSYVRQWNEARGLNKLFMKSQKNKVEKCERSYLKQSDLIFTFNHKDEKLLQEHYHAENVKVINPYYGVDFSEEIKADKIPHSICFVGQMGRDENHVAAMRLIQIFNEINNPGYHLTIIGAHPKDELKKYESNQIHITGFVEDINEEIIKHEIAVFPLTYGAGIKLKVLLAFGLGLPVVTSEIGAEGIDEKGEVLLLANSDAEFKEQIIRLMKDPQFIQKRSAAGIAYVKDHFGWDKTERIFEEIYGKDEKSL